MRKEVKSADQAGIPWPRGCLDAEGAAEQLQRQIIDVLQQVMCTHDAEKLAISVLDIYEDGYRQARSSK